MVKRALLAGDGAPVESVSSTAGPFSEQMKYANPLGNLYFTQLERQRLGIGKQSIGSIDLLAGAPDYGVKTIQDRSVW